MTPDRNICRPVRPNEGAERNFVVRTLGAREEERLKGGNLRRSYAYGST
jgi:hypothetical protein